MENTPVLFENSSLRLSVQGDTRCCWRYTIKETGHSYKVAGPVFEIGGAEHPAVLTQLRWDGQSRKLPSGVSEYRCQGIFAYDPYLSLEIIYQFSEENPTVRFAYALRSQVGHYLTRPMKKDALTYFSVSFATLPSVREISFLDPLDFADSSNLGIRQLEQRHFEDEITVHGPLIFGSNDPYTMLVTYEPGRPETQLHYCLSPERSITLEAVEGNYSHNQLITANYPYTTPWFHMAAMKGTREQLAENYRAYLHTYASQERELVAPGSAEVSSTHQPV